MRYARLRLGPSSLRLGRPGATATVLFGVQEALRAATRSPGAGHNIAYAPGLDALDVDIDQKLAVRLRVLFPPSGLANLQLCLRTQTGLELTISPSPDARRSFLARNCLGSSSYRRGDCVCIAMGVFHGCAVNLDPDESAIYAA